MKLSNILSFCVLATAASAAPSFVSSFEDDGAKALKNHRGGNNIMDKLREHKCFSKFVEVLERERGLRDELERGGQTTVFAPTNSAFEKMAAGEDREEKIRDVIKYHIASETDITKDCLHAGALIPTSLRLKSLEDRHQRIRVFRFADSVWLNMHSRVEHRDIEADNGRIFAIDKVLEVPRNVNEMLWTLPTQFSTFSAALERTGMCKEVAREKGLTVFAPSNAAWKQLGLENLKYLFSCVGQETESGHSSRDSESRPTCRGTKDLKKIVEMHVATELAYSTDIMKKRSMSLKTLGNEEIKVCAKQRNKSERDSYRDEDRDNDKGEGEHQDVRRYNFVLNNGEARIQFTDGLAWNGGIHVIDNVIVPKGVRLPHDKWMQQ